MVIVEAQIAVPLAERIIDLGQYGTKSACAD